MLLWTLTKTQPHCLHEAEGEEAEEGGVAGEGGEVSDCIICLEYEMVMKVQREIHGGKLMFQMFNHECGLDTSKEPKANTPLSA